MTSPSGKNREKFHGTREKLLGLGFPLCLEMLFSSHFKRQHLTLRPCLKNCLFALPTQVFKEWVGR